VWRAVREVRALHQDHDAPQQKEQRQHGKQQEQNEQCHATPGSKATRPNSTRRRISAANSKNKSTGALTEIKGVLMMRCSGSAAKSKRNIASATPAPRAHRAREAEHTPKPGETQCRRPSAVLANYPLPYIPTVRGVPTTNQACTPVARSAAAKLIACSSNGAFALDQAA
jgi:hypothetical protein